LQGLLGLSHTRLCVLTLLHQVRLHGLECLVVDLPGEILG